MLVAGCGAALNVSKNASEGKDSGTGITTSYDTTDVAEILTLVDGCAFVSITDNTSDTDGGTGFKGSVNGNRAAVDARTIDLFASCAFRIGSSNDTTNPEFAAH